MSEVVIVGSSRAHVREKLAPKLEQHGIFVLEHWDWNSAPKSQLPKSTKGVLLITPETPMNLATHARNLASKHDVICVDIVRDFSKALGALDRAGLVTSKKETRRRTVRLPVPKREKASTDAKAYSEAVGWAALHVEDRPEKPVQEIMEAIRGEVPQLSTSDLNRAIQEAKKNFRQRWENWKGVPNEERAKAHQVKLGWASRYMKAALQSNGEVPPYSEVDRECRKIFGHGLSTRFITQVRDEVRGTTRAPQGIQEGQGGQTSEVPKATVSSPLPAQMPKMSRVSRRRVQKNLDDANQFLGGLSEDSRNQIRDWFLRVDRGDLSGKVPESLAPLRGDPLTFSLVALLSTPEETRPMKASLSRGYRRLAGKKLDHQHVVAAFWATGMTARTRQETPVAKTKPIKAPVVEAAETPVVETPVAETKAAETPVVETKAVEATETKAALLTLRGKLGNVSRRNSQLQAKVSSLEAENKSLQTAMRAAEKGEEALRGERDALAALVKDLQAKVAEPQAKVAEPHSEASNEVTLRELLNMGYDIKLRAPR